MLRRLLPILLGAALGPALPEPLAGQDAFPAAGEAVFPASNGQVLADVTTVDAQVLVLNWLDIARDREGFRAEAQSAFGQALRRDGLTVDRNAPAFLFCELKVTEAANGVVVYSWAVGFYEFVVGGVHRLQWTTGGIVKVGRRNFSGQVATEECQEGFRREWLRWNPPGL